MSDLALAKAAVESLKKAQREFDDMIKQGATRARLQAASGFLKDAQEKVSASIKS